MKLKEGNNERYTQPNLRIQRTEGVDVITASVKDEGYQDDFFGPDPA